MWIHLCCNALVVHRCSRCSKQGSPFSFFMLMCVFLRKPAATEDSSQVSSCSPFACWPAGIGRKKQHILQAWIVGRLSDWLCECACTLCVCVLADFGVAVLLFGSYRSLAWMLSGHLCGQSRPPRPIRTFPCPQWHTCLLTPVVQLTTVTFVVSLSFGNTFFFTSLLPSFLSSFQGVSYN